MLAPHSSDSSSPAGGDAGPGYSPAAGHAASGRSAVLVIDDEPTVADALRLILCDEGHRVLVAATGRDGLAVARRERVRVVITDLRLPDISGLEVVVTLRRERPHLNAILITSHAAPELSAEARRVGAALLLKPFAPAEIIRLVERFK
ncbi:MAG TPA: response regulator [Pyrinomonadaceae bacterium]|nr:response regulator [Pyrinomonadaceae bacterium]